MRVLMIHGRAQGGKIVDELKTTWIDTLKEGFQAAGKPWPANVQFDFPYYGDKLDSLVAEADLPTVAGVAAKGGGENPQYAQFVASALTEMAAKSAVPDAEIRAQLPPGAPQEKGPQNWAWVQAIARHIDNRFAPASLFTIEKFLRDVFLYVTKKNVSGPIDAIVEAMLTKEPTLVVSHSLGTVVAYNVVNKHRAEVPFVKHITVGSPLGIGAVSSKLGVPQNIFGDGGWYNAYDERDIVALNPLDDTYFGTDPAIVNYNQVKNKTSNRHGIIGYLNDAKVAAQIAAAIT